MLTNLCVFLLLISLLLQGCQARTQRDRGEIIFLPYTPKAQTPTLCTSSRDLGPQKSLSKWLCVCLQDFCLARTMPLECITLSSRVAKCLLFAKGENEAWACRLEYYTCTLEALHSVGQSWKKEEKAESVWIFPYYQDSV